MIRLRDPQADCLLFLPSPSLPHFTEEETEAERSCNRASTAWIGLCGIAEWNWPCHTLSRTPGTKCRPGTSCMSQKHNRYLLGLSTCRSQQHFELLVLPQPPPRVLPWSPPSPQYLCSHSTLRAACPPPLVPCLSSEEAPCSFLQQIFCFRLCSCCLFPRVSLPAPGPWHMTLLLDCLASPHHPPFTQYDGFDPSCLDPWGLLSGHSDTTAWPEVYNPYFPWALPLALCEARPCLQRPLACPPKSAAWTTPANGQEGVPVGPHCSSMPLAQGRPQHPQPFL